MSDDLDNDLYCGMPISDSICPAMYIRCPVGNFNFSHWLSNTFTGKSAFPVCIWDIR